MNVLVIGGSYFLGRYFVNLTSSKHNITVFNRGNNPLGIPGVEEITGDRHDLVALSALKDKAFDAVVDFCAYNSEDISFFLNNMEKTPAQYIFISTVDVYERGYTGTKQHNESRNGSTSESADAELPFFADENTPFETRDFGGEAGQYILGKVALEKEIAQICPQKDIKYTVFRPAFIYGPGNYAPREGIYFHWIEQAGQILHPVDATGEFQMAFVGDVARAIDAAIGNPETFNRAYNIAPKPPVTYEAFADALLDAVGTPFERVPVSVEFVNQNGIPLPFPLTKEESNLYDGMEVLSLIGKYTDLAEGLKQTIIGR